MNFLAHALLAGEEPALIVGGVVGDWIKGTLPGALPVDLARGVALHRAIDVFAETHPAFCRSRTRVSASRRRYAGVLVDIFYDHLLARAWEAHHDRPLDDYCARVYAHIGDRLQDLPPAARPALSMMAREGWLQSYTRIEGIADVLARMSLRARQPNPIAQAEREFIADETGFADDFACWLPEAQAFVRNWLHRREAPDSA